jgi:hypothetical protein
LKTYETLQITLPGTKIPLSKPLIEEEFLTAGVSAARHFSNIETNAATLREG